MPLIITGARLLFLVRALPLALVIKSYRAQISAQFPIIHARPVQSMAIIGALHRALAYRPHQLVVQLLFLLHRPVQQSRRHVLPALFTIFGAWTITSAVIASLGAII